MSSKCDKRELYVYIINLKHRQVIGVKTGHRWVENYLLLQVWLC